MDQIFSNHIIFRLLLHAPVFAKHFLIFLSSNFHLDDLLFYFCPVTTIDSGCFSFLFFVLNC